MTESILLDEVYKKLKGLSTPKGHPLFSQVIKGTVPSPDAIRSYPSVAFYIAESTYTNNKSYQTVDSEVLIYIYNKHRTTGLDVEDINSPLVREVRGVITSGLQDKNILSSSVTSSIHDGGSIFPRTVVELTSHIEYIETKDCV
jgi:hypothetical protein